jgi:hypothetical protein
MNFNRHRTGVDTRAYIGNSLLLYNTLTHKSGTAVEENVRGLEKVGRPSRQ